jgi:hypothetical protein
MGQFCSTKKLPSKGKDNALVDPSSASLDITQCDLTSTIASSTDPQSGDGEKNHHMLPDEMSLAKQREAHEAERALREKQRLELIVSNARQSMLAVHRRNGYYHDAEAAVMAAGNLVNSNRTIKQFTCQFDPVHPSTADSMPEAEWRQAAEEEEEDIIKILSKEMPWDQYQRSKQQQHLITSHTDNVHPQQQELTTTTTSHGIEWSWLLGTASGENVTMYLDDLAESFLANMLPPSKEQFGSGLDPIVENLP